MKYSFQLGKKNDSTFESFDDTVSLFGGSDLFKCQNTRIRTCLLESSNLMLASCTANGNI
ncbi:uncharacterized protein PHALS_15061 [Plasmopara halstedii]|uniref:Uncharacterized protein n=1 Tax=Plasmopara halstedii TaxID=4781 RepID=A0A0P1AA02_PLAHL|nr:uncharacterized protein PHALS_15061 [Plasmopara halstedii]CEG37317.1 hypothetical protein PHALS_15061 [Plasmopara halstedii]|eukprot:XP_024573686.1 hypothetical protein PHALS_15061 [Plasmopara halstedii]